MPKGLGLEGEEAARAKYQSLGYTLIAENYFNRYGKQLGEIDFIVRKEKNLVFVEVKTRTSNLEDALSAVTRAKQAKMLLAARSFLAKFPEYSEYYIQFDVCAVLVGKFDKTIHDVIIISNVMDCPV